MNTPPQPYALAAARIVAALTEAQPGYEIIMEDSSERPNMAAVKIRLPNDCALIFSVADQATTAYLSVPQTTPAQDFQQDRSQVLFLALYREALRNDCPDDLTGWLSMVTCMPEFPAFSFRIDNVIMQGYRVNRTIHLFDAAKNRSVKVMKHEVLAHNPAFNVIAQVAVDGKSAYGWIRLIDQRFQNGIKNGIFTPLPLGGGNPGSFAFPEDEVRAMAGLSPLLRPGHPTQQPPRGPDDAFPLGEPKP